MQWRKSRIQLALPVVSSWEGFCSPEDHLLFVMRALVRRVLSATVSVNSQAVGEINRGLLVYLAVHRDDEDSDLEWISQKILGMRVFDDDKRKK